MTNTAIDLADLLDETAEIMSQGYRLARVYKVRLDGETYKLRAEVRYDSYEKQSFAAVSVLNDELKWTHLASTPTGVWYAIVARHTDPTLDVVHELSWVAETLVERAVAILA